MTTMSTATEEQTTTTPGMNTLLADAVDDERIPVTVCITPAEAVRLELLIAAYRDRHPGADDTHVIDAIFLAGLAAAELTLCQPVPEPTA